MATIARSATCCMALLIASALVGVAWGRGGDPFAPGGACVIQLNNCTKMVQPFVNDSRYMFPTNDRDVEVVCKIWSRFVECVRRYMADCSTNDQRNQFHSAVDNSVVTVHAICSTDRSKKDYLASAECFKRVSMNDCGSYYQFMIDQVVNPYSQDEHICCAFSQFQQCSKDLLQHQCGTSAQTLMEHSLNFYTARCKKNHHYSLSYRCPVAPPALEMDMYPPYGSGSRTPPSLARSLGDGGSFTTLGPTPYPWASRTVIYTLPPTQSSRTGTNSAQSPALSKTISTLLVLALALALC